MLMPLILIKKQDMKQWLIKHIITDYQRQTLWTALGFYIYRNQCGRNTAIVNAAKTVMQDISYLFEDMEPYKPKSKKSSTTNTVK